MSNQPEQPELAVTEGICAPDAHEPRDPQTERAQVGIGIFLIVAIGFLAFFGTWNTPLQSADLDLFAKSDALHRIVTFPEALDALPAAPLTLFGLALNWVLTPFPGALHAVSLLMHLASAVLLYLIARRLLDRSVSEPVAMLAGLVLAVHPLAVANISCLAGRPAVQATFFSLLAVWLFLGGVTSSGLSPTHLGAAMAAYVLAVGSHNWALVLPVLLLGFDGRHGMRVVWRHGPVHGLFFGLFVALAVALAATGDSVAPANAGATLKAISQYAALAMNRLFLPAAISLPPALPPASGLWWGGGVLAVLVMLGGVALYRQSAVAGALLGLVASAVAVPVLAPLESALAPALAYFPLACTALLLPWLFQLLRRQKVRVAAGVLAVALVLVLAVLAYQRGALWRDPVRLWPEAARQAPESAAPWRNLGAFFRHAANNAASPEAQQELLTQAEEPFRNALERAPDDPELMSSLGAILHAAGKHEEALPLLESALRENPFDQEAAIHLALVYEGRAGGAQGREALRKALDYFRAAETSGPVPGEARAHYGMVLAAFGQYGEAARHLAAAAPPGAQDSPLATSRDRFKQMAERVQQLEAAANQKLAEHPQAVEGLVAQAEAHVVRGHTLDAFYLLDFALEREPGNRNAWQLMGFVCAQMDSRDRFLSEWSAPFAGNEEAWKQLAGRCAAGGAWDAAQAYLGAEMRASESAELPRVTLADIARQLRQPRRAYALLRQATEAHPDNPAPWLELADLALSGNDPANARKYLNEAEQRGAFEEELEARREKLDGTPARPEAMGEPVRSIIR